MTPAEQQLHDIAGGFVAGGTLVRCPSCNQGFDSTTMHFCTTGRVVGANDMTNLRDQFAMAALTGMIREHYDPAEAKAETICVAAYIIADAMLAEGEEVIPNDKVELLAKTIVDALARVPTAESIYTAIELAYKMGLVDGALAVAYQLTTRAEITQ